MNIVVELFNKLVDLDNLSKNWPFRPNNWEGIIIYPNDSVVLTEPQLDYLKKYLKILGEESFFLADIEFELEAFSKPEHYSHFNISDEYNKYLTLHESSTDHVYFSLSARWAIITRHNFVTIFASNKGEIDCFKKIYSEWKSDFNCFCKEFKDEYPEFSIEGFDPDSKIVKP